MNMITIISSWDDGAKQDIRLAKLLKKYNMSGIFYIPNTTELSIFELMELAKDFEIGGHTISHPADMKALSKVELYDEIRGNRKWLKLITGQPINKFCYPKGRYNELVIDVLKGSGFMEARTVLVLNTETPLDRYRTNPTIHVYPKRQEYNGENWLELAKRLYKEAVEKENGYYHIWGHSWELDKFGLWEELEELLKYIKNYGNENN